MIQHTKIRPEVAGLLALIAVSTPAAIAQQPLGADAFRAFTPLPIGDEPVDGECVDLNGDGNPDLVSLNFKSQDLSILIGDGVGGFEPMHAVHVKKLPAGMCAADLDGDGDIDLVTTHQANRYQGVEAGLIGIHLNQGDGLIFDSRYLEGPFLNSPGDIVALDSDLDGNLDLITPDGLGGYLHVLRGLGDGEFELGYTRVSFPFSGYLRAGDMDLDGDLDLVATSSQSTDATAILLNTGDGSFELTHQYETGNNPFALDLGDLNGDGALDIVVSVYTSAEYAVLLNQGDGSMFPPTLMPAGIEPRDIRLHDTDFDGDLDLLICDQLGGEVRIFANAGNGAFELTQRVGAGVEPYSMAIGDLDRDGFEDIVTLNRSYTYEADYAAMLRSDRQGGYISDQRIGAGAYRDRGIGMNINNDGLHDLTLIEHSTPRLHLLSNTGQGDFVLATIIPLEGEQAQVQTTDLNGNGRDDLVIKYEDQNTYSVIINPVSPSQDRYTIDAFTTEPSEIVFGDLDLDGHTDAVVNLPDQDLLQLLRNDGSGHFSNAGQIDISRHGGKVLLADLNADGDLDIVTCGGALYVHKNDGDMSFHYHNRFTYDWWATEYGVIDYDRDGRDDVISVYRNEARVGITRGKADGAMWPTIYIDTPVQPDEMAISDIDLDGDDDLVLTNDYFSTMSIMRNEGPMTLTPARVWPMAGNVSSLIVADATGNGMPDILTYNTGSSSFSLLRNQINQTPCAADITGDGLLDLFDINAFVTLFLNNADDADFNADGETNFLDVSAFIISYQNGCP